MFQNCLIAKVYGMFSTFIHLNIEFTIDCETRHVFLLNLKATIANNKGKCAGVKSIFLLTTIMCFINNNKEKLNRCLVLLKK